MTEDMTPLLTKEEVCQILGVKETWLNAEIAAGNIPHIRLGRKKFIRFRPDHIATYLASKEQGVTDDDGV
jgi:excisionase family DNA binding protein